jgi:hypothetical protein
MDCIELKKHRSNMFKSGEFGGWDMSLISNPYFLVASQNIFFIGSNMGWCIVMLYIYGLDGVFLQPLHMNRRQDLLNQ